MYKISKSFTFDAAHQLKIATLDADANIKRFGKCHNPHGHTYTLTVYIRGNALNDDGMLINFEKISQAVKPLLDRIDHSFLNFEFPLKTEGTQKKHFLTTTEKMAKEIYYYLKAILPSLHKIRLSETPKTYAEFNGSE